MLLTPETPSDRRVQKVLAILERDLVVDIGELSKRVNLSPSRLEHLFKEQMGLALGNHVLQCRLRTAAKLLQSTEMRIKEIAYVVGYEHPSNFMRAFKNKFGTTPSDHRRSLAKIANE